MYGDTIAAANGDATGDFIGGLMNNDGRMLVNRNGDLYAVDAYILRLDEQNQGYCNVCEKVVSWTAVQGSDNIQVSLA